MNWIHQFQDFLLQTSAEISNRWIFVLWNQLLVRGIVHTVSLRLSPTCIILNPCCPCRTTAWLSERKKPQHSSGCHNTSQESNVSHWPTIPLIYSCIANTKTQTRAAYATWPCRGLLWCDVITPHCHKWTAALLRLPVNKFWRGLGHTSPLYCALDGHGIIAMQRVARFLF